MNRKMLDDNEKFIDCKMGVARQLGVEGVGMRGLHMVG